MDTSKEYIKMCKQANEIQDQKPNPSDSSAQFFVCEICGGFYQEDMGSNFCEAHIDESVSPVWLPRQDRLQRIAFYEKGVEFVSVEFMLDKLFGFVGNKPIRETSLEQLWLAFVMKEKFNKIWNGEEWIA